MRLRVWEGPGGQVGKEREEGGDRSLEAGGGGWSLCISDRVLSGILLKHPRGWGAGWGMVCLPSSASSVSNLLQAGPPALLAAGHVSSSGKGPLGWFEQQRWVWWSRKSPPASRPFASFFKYFVWFPDVNEGEVRCSQTGAPCFGRGGRLGGEAGL